MYAVIRTGGKQYRVAPDDVIEIERLAANAGDQIQFDEVLMVAGDGGVAFGAPLVVGATVAGEVKALTRGPKLIIFKKRRRKHFRRKNGHRQDLMEVRITEILTEGRNPAQRATPAATAEALADFADAGDDDEVGDDLEEFEDEEDDRFLYLGDIAISHETATRQAAQAGHSLGWECAYLLAHGVLHLVGYDDKTDAGYQAMTARQEKILAELGIAK
jgi:large subunit ribosomal protein L21